MSDLSQFIPAATDPAALNIATLIIAPAEITTAIAAGLDEIGPTIAAKLAGKSPYARLAFALVWPILKPILAAEVTSLLMKSIGTHEHAA